MLILLPVAAVVGAIGVVTWAAIEERPKPEAVRFEGAVSVDRVMTHLNQFMEIARRDPTGMSISVLVWVFRSSYTHTHTHSLSLSLSLSLSHTHTQVYDQILAYHSREGEDVQMSEPVMAQGNVENWLGTFLVAQQKSLAEVIADATLGIQEDGVDLVE